MINAKLRDELISQFKSKSREMFDSVKENYKLAEAMESNDVDSIRDIVKKVQLIMVANIPDGLKIPKTSLYVSPTGTDSISIVNITISNRISDENKKFSYSSAVTKSNCIEKVFDFVQSVFVALIVDDLVNENLAKVNDVLAQAAAESGIEYEIKVVSSLGNEGKKIASMSDDKIVFVADEERVFSLENIIVLLDEPFELITSEVIEDHYQRIVEELSTAQTPEQLVGIHGGALVSYVCDISKRLKPVTLIKKICSKNISKIHGDKDTIAYFFENDVYALIARRDGKFEVILSPFDVKTLHKVDVDVLKAIA